MDWMIDSKHMHALRNVDKVGNKWNDKERIGNTSSPQVYHNFKHMRYRMCDLKWYSMLIIVIW